MEVAQGSRSSRAVLQTSGSARQEAGGGVELAELCLSQDISLPRGWVGSWAGGDERRGEGNLTGEESCLGTRPSPEIPKTNTCGASTGHRACHEARAVISLKRIHLAMQETRVSGSVPGSGRSPGEGNGIPLQCSCLENSTDRGVRRATVHGVPKGQA